MTALEERQGSEAYIESLVRVARLSTRSSAKPVRRLSFMQDIPEHGLFGLSQVQRLAFEMALHEEAERRAMQGELAELERAWRDAEEIAKIADDLLVPTSVGERLAKLRESL